MLKLVSLKAIVSNDLDKNSGQATMYLTEESTLMVLPILVDASAAEGLLLAQQNILLPRPHTHDLLKRAFKAFGAKVIDVVIYDLREGIYYSYIRITNEKGDLLELDCKPSDAVAMSLRCQVPILVKDAVLEMGGIKVTQSLLEE